MFKEKRSFNRFNFFTLELEEYQKLFKCTKANKKEDDMHSHLGILIKTIFLIEGLPTT